MLDNSPVGIARNVKELQIPTLEKYWKTQQKKKKSRYISFRIVETLHK